MKKAFYGCSNLVSVILPTNLKSIETSTFEGCVKLRSIYLPSGLTKLGAYAFRNCSLLSSIDLPNGLLIIETMAFYNCRSLTELTFPDSLLSIDTLVCLDCSALTRVTININFIYQIKSLFSTDGIDFTVTGDGTIATTSFDNVKGYRIVNTLTFKGEIYQVEEGAFRNWG